MPSASFANTTDPKSVEWANTYSKLDDITYSKLDDIGQKYNGQRFKVWCPDCSSSCCAGATLTKIQSVTLFILASVAALNVGSSVTIGGVAIGLSTGMFLTSLCTGNIRKNKVTHLLSALASLSYIALGGLGIGRFMTTPQLGISLLGAHVVFGVVGLGACCFRWTCSREAKERNAQLQKINDAHIDENNQVYKELAESNRELEERKAQLQKINTELRSVVGQVYEELEKLSQEAQAEEVAGQTSQVSQKPQTAPKADDID